ncbi:hypothetical protein SH668x_003210 [Planctomicrobium sp. SH668]|uniref:hypothetical protein n=1 Tax=Planctomicrobium sp. SH668 TaxID=3448126 RepID=UPI003F5B7652
MPCAIRPAAKAITTDEPNGLSPNSVGLSLTKTRSSFGAVSGMPELRLWLVSGKLVATSSLKTGGTTTLIAQLGQGKELPAFRDGALSFDPQPSHEKLISPFISLALGTVSNDCSGIAANTIRANFNSLLTCLVLMHDNRYKATLHAVGANHDVHSQTLRYHRKDRYVVFNPHKRAYRPAFCCRALRVSPAARPPPKMFLAAPGVIRFGLAVLVK